MTRMICVTATGTGVGKTLVTAALAHQARAAGKKTLALKPVISGWDGGADSDTHQLLAAQGLAATEEEIARISPWRFADPVSPHIAAARAGATLSASEIVNYCRKQAEGHEIAFIEGAGGVMAPIATKQTFLEVIEPLGAEVVLVAGSYLGTLSHTLTALEVLKARGVHPLLLVISESVQSPMPLAETEASLRGFAPGVPFAVVPRLAGPPPLWPSVPDLFTTMG
ncbi:MAG: dethiobiotin synthase [Alphaproteobacteria bacterium]|nr:dethiobiotin synthase [Alphaproteobacteria bacterium]